MSASSPDHVGRQPPGPAVRSPDGLPDLSDAGMYLVHDNGSIVSVNARAEELLGRTAAELVGHDAHDLLHRDHLGQTMTRSSCTMMRVLLSGRTGGGDREWFERGDGTLLPVTWLVTPCRLDDGAAGVAVLFYESAAGNESLRSVDSTTLSQLDRLALLAETTTRLTSTLDADEAIARLVRLVVPRLADWAVVDLITESDDVWRDTVATHHNGAVVRREELEGPLPPVHEESFMPLSRALRGAASALAGPETYQGPPDSGITVAQQKLFQVTGLRSAAIAPIRGPRAVLGALTLGLSDRPGSFTDTELSLLEDIARRAGLALENARLYQRQRHIAETMQRHLLPQMPEVPGLKMAARYESASESSQVGGDWYDVFSLSDGATAVAIGDVVGHNIDAAAGMAQVRNMLRAYAWALHEPPSIIVERLDQAVVNVAEASMATLIFGRVERDDEDWTLRWTNAGHPPPLLITHDGRSRFLDEEHDHLLGTGLVRARSDTLTRLPPLSTLVLYTDGLIESPGQTLDRGLARLRQHAAALAHRPLHVFCDLLLERARPVDNDDDVALLVLRTPDGGGETGDL
ncbi:SpoIIE family protein phosphatase [Streptomyces stelliscabiei]|uniref:protein-serine/threonine phosphatase n=1 Tax=Streptomyces stelliscabiei TaxID=146820 RepID=A0A8I0TNN8_9ACTN|nr:SpoIIE family protein phosphatase [Streptomyces stelliscabiei]KND43176.1 DNA-binding protein [Streptomyces stelliscabiei]MBE1594739.1 PAS domain S-box-containing protein [Streptomyces stelliscabiei]MDX2519020.1 SpoIIE family protein phosphatase [Streptomyces stelliscabiei]MDX2550875.1 SpoIIE family protein phosphatase [Streptomyces stelliscabiei]MDX2616643.1 SpoIIE family protein phosphatase [Streptomyces stelliscabiei]